MITMTREGGKEENPRCVNCEQREGTENFSDWPDGRFSTKWCKICVLEIQLKHARERAAAIPQLEADLAAALKELE